MNSMIQQFYMVPSFRYSILKLEAKAANMQMYKDREGNEFEVDDTVINQF